MPPPICLRCLSRSLRISGSRAAPTSATRAFSSTARFDQLKKPTPNQKGSSALRPGSTLRLGKRERTPPAGRAPAPGERKAYRKRIVLSNTNALEVPGLPDLTSTLVRQNGHELALNKYQGHVLGFTSKTVDALRALESFRATQGWAMFHRPASLVHAETLRLAEDIAKIHQGRRDASKQQSAEMQQDSTTRQNDEEQQSLEEPDTTVRQPAAVRKVLFGARDTGKSVLLLQAQAMALQKGFIVVHFPEGQDLINAHTAYQPLTTPDGVVYTQPQYTANLLKNLARANNDVLSSLTLSQQHRLPVPVQPNMSLARFAELGASDLELAWPVWQALWTELTTPSPKGAEGGLRRPPVLVSMDGVDQVMQTSAYLDSDVRPIHAHDLALVKHFCGLLSGETALPNGGMVLAATCASYQARTPTTKYWLQRLALEQSQVATSTLPKWDPFTAKDSRVEEVMKTVEAVEVRGLSKEETRGVMEYYARSGLFRGSVTDGLVSEQWTLAGSGIIGLLEKSTVRARF